MNKLFSILTLIMLVGCAGQKSASTTGNTTSNAGSGNTRTGKAELINDQTYRLTASTDDKTYGYTEKNPVKVGGVKENSGPKNERRFLNALTGPNGEEVSYSRSGSCCYFKTPNGIGDIGLLDRYRVTWKNSSDTVNIYINMYDKGDLLIPVGFKAKQ